VDGVMLTAFVVRFQVSWWSGSAVVLASDPEEAKALVLRHVDEEPDLVEVEAAWSTNHPRVIYSDAGIAA
jgi:hypothetical protein